MAAPHFFYAHFAADLNVLDPAIIRRAKRSVHSAPLVLPFRPCDRLT